MARLALSRREKAGACAGQRLSAPAGSSAWPGGLGRIIAYLTLAAWALVSLLPIYWMFTTALKTPSIAVAIPPEWIPASLTLENFARLFRAEQMGRWTFNSLFVAGAATLAYVLTSTMAGYAFAKKDFPGRNAIFWAYVSTMLVPGFVTLITSYTVVVDLGWIDSYWALIIPELASPFGAFLMRQFILSLPSEIFDAARIDGCGEWQVFWRVVLPLSAAGMAVLAVFHFSYMWNSFIWPLAVTTSDSMRTLPVGLAGMQRVRATNFSLLMAGASYASLPMIAIFLLAQRYFLRGITVGAVKG
jgi:multiple sugar transport system permease protein